MNNRNFDNEIQTSGDMVIKIAQNNALLLKTPSTFTATQTYDQINVNKITYVTLPNNTINLGGSSIGSNIICIGNSVTAADNNIILGHFSGINSTTSFNNVYIGNNISHLASNNFSNSTAIGNGSVISASNTIFIGTSAQQIQLYNTIISNPPLFDYISYPNLVSNQSGFQKNFIKTGIFNNSLDIIQILSSFIMTAGLYNIVYSISITPVTISTTLDKFQATVSIGDNLPTQLQMQSNLINIRVDTKNQNKLINYNYGNSTMFNNTSGAKTFNLSMIFYTSEMVLPLSPINYTYSVSVITTRIW